MSRIEGSTTIRRPPDVVFDMVADERNEPRYNPEIVRVEKVTEGPLGPGTRFRAVAGSRPRPTEIRVELTAYERPRFFSSRVHMLGMDTRGRVTCEPAGEGTHARWSWELEGPRLLRLLAPLLAPVIRRHEERVWERMRAYLESS